MTRRRNNLLFLLAAAPLALPGCDPDRSDGDDGARPGGSSTTAAPDSPTTDGTGSGSTDAPPDADGESTADADTAADGEPSTGGGTGDVPPVCEPYADTTIPCYGASLEGLKACSSLYAGAQYVGADCIEVFIDYFACLSQSSCEAVGDDCPDEVTAYNKTCLID